ncbi:MAG: tubulin-like doman-containing protein [Polyangiaceae bacterium]
MIQKMKIAPHLFIGLGGCGSKIVNEIARKFKRNDEQYERYRDLVHFFVFDTDQHELKQAESADVRVAISDFDKRDFVAHAFGQRGAPEDQLFTSWWPEHYMPRDVAGAGAGQIRIESRLSLFFTLEYKPEVLTALERAVGKCFNIDSRFRDVDKAPMIHVYASLAGGTGSGSFLPIALLAHDLFRDHKRPIVVGTFVLPAVFKRAGLPAQQLDKIMANGYAALMELEHMQSASAEDPIPFQYDPRSKELTHVGRRTYDQVYLVDDIGAHREAITDTRQIYQAIADSAHAQIFSDILGRQASTADNDEREMGVTDVQQYTKRYGSFGLSVLVVPDEDILDYCAHRFAEEALTRTFALPDEDAATEAASYADRERRDQEFVKALVRQANLPGESGEFYRRVMARCDGAEGEQGAVDRFLRMFDATFAPRFKKHCGGLPRWSEDKLLEYDEAPDLVRTEMPRRLEAWTKFAQKARELVDEEAELIAGERATPTSTASPRSRATGAIFERLFLIRTASKPARSRLGAGPPRARPSRSSSGSAKPICAGWSASRRPRPRRSPSTCAATTTGARWCRSSWAGTAATWRARRSPCSRPPAWSTSARISSPRSSGARIGSARSSASSSISAARCARPARSCSPSGCAASRAG